MGCDSLLFFKSCAVVVFLLIGSTMAYQVRYEGNQQITTFDGQTLHADGFIPIPNNATQRFPLIIFPNSWACPQIEYVLKTLNFAEAGFITLEYETRGWYLSGGQIDVAGPLDRRDISTVIDYAISKTDDWQVNVSAIAMVGISYGAGLSLEAAGFEPRLATVVSLSGWNNMTLALYDHNTPNKAWADVLEWTADLLGHPQPDLSVLIGDLISHNNLSYIEAFASRRSPAVNLSFINERQIPILVSNNFLDRLFKPNDMIEFWLQLTVPKLLLLNQGMHAEAEIGGLLDLPGNYVWQQVQLWLTHFLMGVDTGIMSQPPIQMQVEYRGNTYAMLNSWPDNAVVQPVTMYLGNRAGEHYGQFVQGAVPSPRSGPLDVINYNEVTGIYDGVPLLSDALDEFVPTTNELLAYIESGAVVYMSSPLANATRICGTPEYQIKFMPSSDTWQLYGFLYDVDALDVGEIIADAFYTSWGGQGENNATVTLKSTFHTMCRDMSAGNRLAVGFVLYNAAYTNPNTNFNVVFYYDEDTWVSVPVNPGQGAERKGITIPK